MLGPLLFLLCENDLPNSSNVLVPMFADDTNSLFYQRSNKLFKAVNEELIKINAWFPANKVSLNVGKTKFSLFHKSGKRFSIRSPLPTLKINNHDIERVNTMKFLGVLLDDNLSWIEHIKYLENKIAKNVGLRQNNFQMKNPCQHCITKWLSASPSSVFSLGQYTE